jgi:DNA-binding NtrC family response regulator
MTSDMKPVSPDKGFWRLMVVDDEQVVTHVLKGTLADDGYKNVTLVSDGETAIKNLQSRAYHLVLVDKNLPGIDGLEVIREGKRLRPSCQFILITGFASLDSAIKAMELGACYYLSKPLPDADHICQLVKSALEKVAYSIHLDSLILRMTNTIKKLAARIPEDHPGRTDAEQLITLVNQLRELVKQKPVSQ